MIISGALDITSSVGISTVLDLNLPRIADRTMQFAINTQALSIGNTAFSLISTSITGQQINYNVFWGDGNSSLGITTTTVSYQYSTPGNYTVSIVNNTGIAAYTPYNTGITTVASLYKTFNGAYPFNFGTNLTNAWDGCSNMIAFSPIDTSNVTNFFQTWRSCSRLTSFPELDTSKGITFFNTWRSCSRLTSFPLLNTSNVTNFRDAWVGCSGLTSFPELDTSKVITFGGTWDGCSGLTTFPLLNSSGVTEFLNTWRNCSRLTSFPELDTSKGITFFNTWQGCSGITTFPLLNTSKGTNFTSTWQGCTKLSDFPNNFFNVGIATNYTNAFISCGLTTTSVENIIIGINSSANLNNLTNGRLDISGGTSAGQSSLGSTALLALTNLRTTRGWTVNLNA
jgi:hypothetical protein